MQREGEGVVIEAKLDKGRGCKHGSGAARRAESRDIFVVGRSGRVRLINGRGEQVDEAGPAVPAKYRRWRAGWGSFPQWLKQARVKWLNTPRARKSSTTRRARLA